MPPPPVSGAATGNSVCVTVRVGWTRVRVTVGSTLVRVTVAVGVPGARGEAVFVGTVVERPGPDGAVLVDAPAPVGDGVRVAGPDDCPLVGGVGVKTEGTEEPLPPAVQAETEAATSTAPAARAAATATHPGSHRAKSGASS